MSLKKALPLLLLALLVAACDSSQPNYSASNANSAPPPAVQPPPPPPPPVVEPPKPAPAEVAATPVRSAAPPRAPTRENRQAYYFGQKPGKIGPMEKIGVGNCDDYVERYRACFNNTNLTREQKIPLRQALTGQLRQWSADSKAGKISQVAASCSAADQTARVEFRKVGCTTF